MYLFNKVVALVTGDCIMITSTTGTEQNKMAQSEQAQVASIIRKALKAHGIKCSVKSSSFSMGDKVSVKVFDQLPATLALIESEFAKFKYGSFDGMTDCYEMTNCRDDIPQTKFLSINNEISKELKQQAWDWTRATFSGLEDSPAAYTELMYDDNRALHNTLTQSTGGFWATIKPRTKAA